MKKKIGIVGVGIMGAGMVKNFLKNDYEVYVWNRGKDRLKELIQAGAKELNTPKDVAEKADMIFEVTSDDNSSRAVWLGDDGILSGAISGKILIASSTLSIPWVEELAQICKDKNLNFLDIPLTGGRVGAETGKLIMLAGGDKDKLEEIRTELSAISEQTFYFGPVGSGAKFKLLLNMIQGIHLVAFDEAMRIAKINNMDTREVANALGSRMGAMTANGAKYYDKGPDPINFSLELIEKDLRYAKMFASKIDTPILDEALSKFRQALEKGYGKEDLTIITKI
jgi:3-hydroxyisobutyrate dehydrogenase